VDTDRQLEREEEEEEREEEMGTTQTRTNTEVVLACPSTTVWARDAGRSGAEAVWASFVCAVVIRTQKVQDCELARRAPELRNEHVFPPCRLLVLTHGTEDRAHDFDGLNSDCPLQRCEVVVNLRHEIVAFQTCGNVGHALQLAHKFVRETAG
jgi:hypothetical protein